MAEDNENAHLEPRDQVSGDKITVGDISGSLTAISAGAQVICQNIQRALTEVEVTEQAAAFETERLAEAVPSAWVS